MIKTSADYPKKLIEVSIPLKEINEASAREKSIRHGHPSTFHLWWARRPLAAARAVLFCQLVDDPSGYLDELIADKVRKKRAEEELAIEMKMAPQVSAKVEDILVMKERDRLHDIVKELVPWENTNNEKVLNKARKEIQKSWARTCRREGQPEDTPMPPFLDPFAGGGAIPLEAQRLGLESHASDLNPVAVLINKAMIEIPPKFVDMPPVHPDARAEMGTTGWKGAAGLAEDVRRYGQWMRDEAFKRIGHLYPPYKLTQELIDSRSDLKEAGYKNGDELKVIAWLWARTVPSPNPALGGKPVPLISSFYLSTKNGMEAWVEPIVKDGDYSFRIRLGEPLDAEKIRSGTKTGRGANFTCLISGVPINSKYIKAEAKSGRMQSRMMAVVCEPTYGRQRIFLPPSSEQEIASEIREIPAVPSLKLSTHPQYMGCVGYGMDEYSKLFTGRQIVALDALSTLAGEASSDAAAQVVALSDSRDAEEYSRAIALILGMSVSRWTDISNTLCRWENTKTQVRNLFSKQAFSMLWDFAENNVFGNAAGDFGTTLKTMVKVLERIQISNPGYVSQQDAVRFAVGERKLILSSDPPYYDNIPYSDLADFFYGALRKILASKYPSLLGTLRTPKNEELVADVKRWNGRDEANAFFMEGMKQFVTRCHEKGHEAFPLTLYYAFKQSEDSDGGVFSSGWDAFLGAICEADFQVTATWPLRTELATRTRSLGANALASSIVLVCKKRQVNSPMATRREFVQALKKELPRALRELQHGNIAPVDLPQSSIGPGMAIYSRYCKVVEADGSSMAVRTALQLINKAVDDFLSEQEAQMDDWTRFAVTWFSQYGFKAGPFGEADGVARAKNVAVEGVADAGIVVSRGGKVRILQKGELDPKWDPEKDDRMTVWEIVHQLIRVLENGSGDEAATILRKVGGLSHEAKALCYRLYTICEKNKWADEGRDYNLLMSEWSRVQDRANQMKEGEMKQDEMFG